jgi:hypothetical protein
MKSLRRSLAAFAAVSVFAVAALAATDPSGTYTFAGFGGRGGGGGGGQGGQGGTPPMSTLVLALKDGKLTGSVTAPGRGGGEPVKTEISDASIKDDTVSFSVKTQGQNGERITKYTGKVSADAITGTVLAPGRGGAEPTPRDWVAKKSK